MENTEEWRIVPGTLGTYSASSWGQVRRQLSFEAEPRILHQSAFADYPSVSFCGNMRTRSQTIAVHRLVAAAFYGAPLVKGHVVMHLNGDKTDNRPCNLAHGTQSRNVLDGLAGHTASMPLMGTQDERGYLPVVYPEYAPIHGCVMPDAA